MFLLPRRGNLGVHVDVGIQVDVGVQVDVSVDVVQSCQVVLLQVVEVVEVGVGQTG
jgi:hypothetical protein